LGAVDRVAADRRGVRQAAEAVNAAHVHPDVAGASLGHELLDLGAELLLDVGAQASFQFESSFQ
jgi:hypothetical protein